MNLTKLCLISSICLLTQSAYAATLVPDTGVPLPGTTLAAEPNLAGLVVEDNLVPFSFSAYGGTVSGEVQNRVVLSDDGTYDFYWRVFNDENSAGVIQDFRIGEFFTSSYNANWRIDGLGDTAPIQAYLFSSPSGAVNFNFTDARGGGGLDPGDSSYFIFLDTDAKFYSQSAIYDLTNIGQTEISPLYETFAPAVPEPETYAMILAGLGLLCFVRRNRNTQ